MLPITKTLNSSKAIIETKPILGTTLLVATVVVAILLYNFFDSSDQDPKGDSSQLVKDKATHLKAAPAEVTQEKFSRLTFLTASVSERSLLDREKIETISLDPEQTTYNRKRSLSF